MVCINTTSGVYAIVSIHDTEFMKTILQTDRFILREMTVEDAKDTFELNSDPEVLKYTGDIPFKDITEARSFLKSYDSYQKYGFGRWAIISKKSNNYLGWCGLKYDPQIDEYDIGFRLFKKYWNKGIATETAKACIKFGFEHFNIKTIVGRAMIENSASIQVLKKIGLN